MYNGHLTCRFVSDTSMVESDAVFDTTPDSPVVTSATIICGEVQVGFVSFAIGVHKY